MKVLLTGASGIVGQALLDRLVDADVTCLVHHAAVHRPGVNQIAGDLREPNLGLSPQQHHDLLTDVDWVVHCAAQTNFTESEGEIFRLNVRGTENIVTLAQAAGARFCHVSTAFARLAEGPAQGVAPNAYARSKGEAEAIVAASGLPYVILRPSRIIGDSRTGAISRFQGFHLLFDLLHRSDGLVVAGSSETYVDFVPVDSVADAIVLLLSKVPDNGAYWLTAGEDALSLRRTLDVEIAEIARLTGRMPAVPVEVSRDEYELEIRPRLFASLPRELHAMLDGFLQMMDSLNLLPFPSSYEELACMGLRPLPNPEATLRRNLLYWARKRGAVRVAGGRGLRGAGP